MLALLGMARLAYNILVPQKESDNTLVNVLKKCCDCLCLVCLKLFECFAHGGYTIININGTPFCESGAEAFKLQLANFDVSSIVTMVQAVILNLFRFSPS